MEIKAKVTLAVPSLNQGKYLDATLESIIDQDMPVEIMLADGGSEDTTLDVIEKWEGQVAWWRSKPDRGQAAAINEAITLGNAPYVGWLNSDDLLKSGGLAAMVAALESNPDVPMVYANSDLINGAGDSAGNYVTSAFSEHALSVRCFIAQPATLIRRSVWQAVGGLDESLHMAMDYDLWWRIYRHAGEPMHIENNVASMRLHDEAKTAAFRTRHYREAMQVLSRHYGRVPLKWYLAWPYAVWGRAIARYLRRHWGTNG